MANKPINTSSNSMKSFDDQMNKDINGVYLPENQWTHARNAVSNTPDGDLNKRSNEPSNTKCIEAPYTIIGFIHIEADEWVVFSTDDIDSEIGLFKESSCNYTTLVNAKCLNFNRANLIYGIGRSTHDCGRKVYWDDGRRNPSRVLDIDNIPWFQTCEENSGCYTCEDTDQLDCDKIRLAPLIQDLSFRIERGNAAGEIINGSYYVVGAYLIEGQRVTDYSLPSNVQPLFTHDNVACSLDIYVQEADPEFDEFELILVQFANFNTVAKKVGVYSTRQKKITLDTINERWPNINPEDILNQNTIPDSSDKIVRNGDYALRIGPEDKLDFNYQPLANQIKTQWVSIEYPMDYYRDGGSNTGYMRDEVYSFFIRWRYNTGDKSKSYHIPGRAATEIDLQGVSGDDVIVGDDIGENLKYWKVYNTASVDPSFPGTGSYLLDGGKVLGGGDMGYWESSEYYDDDRPDVWNAGIEGHPEYDLCGKHIRHHKFPDNATDPSNNIITNHYDPNGSGKIRVMGVNFSNIKPPVDNDGNVLTNVVGYEILRGTREGNKTVLAKGMINNMREYKPIDDEPNRRYLYPNYPYNPKKAYKYKEGTAVYDHFLSETATYYDGGNPNSFNAYLNNDNPLGYLDTNILNDVITFHSPETNFRNPFLSAKELKVYGEVTGTMEGRFQFPKDHPRHKFITDTSFLISALIGIGYAVLSTSGKQTTSYNSANIDVGGTFTQAGVSSGGTGLLGGLSTPATIAQLSAVAGAKATELTANKLLTGSGLGVLLSVAGINASDIRDTSFQTSSGIAAAGGVSGNNSYTTEASAWGSLPPLLRVLQGIPMFLSLWGEGIDKMLEVIYAFTPYRQYALQQISHCYYNKFTRASLGNRRRHIKDSVYLENHLQNFGTDYIINNIYRIRTVALELEKDLALPTNEDDTQVTFKDVWGNNISKWRDHQINSTFKRPAASHYVALKQRQDNQYGQLEGIFQVPVSTDAHSHFNETNGELNQASTSPVLFNGDTYIGRYTEKNTMFFFYDWLKGQPDGTTFDYSLRKMIPHPRFWMNTDPFDVGEFVSGLGEFFDNNSGGVPGNFDPFATTDNATGECDCEHLSNCKYYASNSSEFNDLCTAQTELEQLQLYREFITDCACYRDTGEDGCNPPDDSVSNPILNYSAADCPECHSINSGQCPDWNNPDDYLQEGSGKWARKINKIDRKIKRAQKRYDKAVEKLYDAYMDELGAAGEDTDGEDGLFNTFWNNLQTPRDKYAFDMLGKNELNTFLFKFRMSVKQAFMYLFNSGVRDFYVETEVNIDYRDWGQKEEERHYNHLDYSHLKELFSTDHIKVGNYMKYDYSLSISKLFNNYVSWASMQDRNYNPELAASCYKYRPKRVIYSLSQQLENRKDNWRVYLPFNYKDFNSQVTTIKPIAKNGAIMLFENESPVYFSGTETLETDLNTKLVIGDGELFNQKLQNLVNVDYPHEYGSCQSDKSVINTPYGLFYMSQNQGKIFQVLGQQVNEVSDLGLRWWFSKYLPYKLTEHDAFIDETTRERIPFDLQDNPVIGIGCQAVYDNENKTVFFCKKDWEIRDDILDTLTYIGGNQFMVNKVLKVELGDPRYFRPASWTVSWNPRANQGRGGWISYHDWHPDLVLPTKHTYMTTKDNGIWEHADTCQSFCNFYGIDYPFELEYTVNTKFSVNTTRNIMYFMEAYIYNDNCTDRFHDLDFNFDEAVVYNTEQCSGLLRLNLTPKNDTRARLAYPIINTDSIDILYSKEEQKYRFNQFYDITADRGEFNPIAQRTIFNTEANGYIKNLNPYNLDYNKPAHQHKKFRHYKQSVLLRRRVSGNRNITVNLATQGNLNSSR